jgi:hypothetical protein
MLLNAKRQGGNLSRDEDRLVRAIIPALGGTGRPSAKPALQSVLSLNYDNEVKNLANTALTKLP